MRPPAADIAAVAESALTKHPATVAGRAITITQPRKLDQRLRQHLGEL
jgi:hypothetical protein